MSDKLLRQAHDALRYAWLGLCNGLGHDVAKNNYISVYNAWQALSATGWEYAAPASTGVAEPATERGVWAELDAKLPYKRNPAPDAAPSVPLNAFTTHQFATPALDVAKDAAPDWREPTTYLRRFGDAMQLLCGGTRPTDALLTAWLDSDDTELQDFAATNGPAWAQGIGLIDAARIAADQPTEGVAHEYQDDAPATEPSNTEQLRQIRVLLKDYNEWPDNRSDSRTPMKFLAQIADILNGVTPAQKRISKAIRAAMSHAAPAGVADEEKKS